MKRILILFLLLSSLVSAKMTPSQIDKDIEKLFTIVSQRQELRIKGLFYTIDIKYLIEMTAQIESRYAKDKYSGRIAKSPFQYEMDTVKHYVSLVPELKNYLEQELGREIRVDNENDSVYITYLVYMSKLTYHKKWITKFHSTYYKGDIEWVVYKILWNSTKGASTYKKWVKRKVEREIDKIIS